MSANFDIPNSTRMASDISHVVTRHDVPDPSNQVIITPHSHKVNVMVLDYHDVYLSGFIKVLNVLGFNVVGYAKNEAIFKAQLNVNQFVTEIAIINYKTTRRETLDVAKFVKENYPRIKVVVNTQYAGKLLNEKIKDIGIEGVILKGNEIDQIKKILLAVYTGEIFHVH